MGGAALVHRRDPRACDRVIMEWAARNDFVVLTHDLDFGALLALTHAAGPSVVLVRDADTMPDAIGASIVSALTQHQDDLARGAIVVVDDASSRVRILPLCPLRSMTRMAMQGLWRRTAGS